MRGKTERGTLTDQPAPPSAPSTGEKTDTDRAFAAIVASIERLDDLDLANVEPASTFHWV